MDTMELDQNLARFYVEARTIKGDEYSRSALLGFRSSIERYLNNNGITLKLTGNQMFQNSNKILDAKLRINRRAGINNVQHKPVIEVSDLEKLRTSPFLSMATPAGLLRRTWFYVSLYWCRCGKEGQRDLCRESFKFTQDANGREFAFMTRGKATKYGGNSKYSAQTRLYSTGADNDAFASLKLYVSKLNPSCMSFYQHPKQGVTNADTVWYEKRPLGINKLGEMMKNISAGARLSQIYTNYSVRTTGITLLPNMNVPDCHVMFVSGHSTGQNKSQPSGLQLEIASGTNSNAPEDQNAKGTQISPIMGAPLVQSLNSIASKLLTSSNIQENIQVFFRFQNSSDDKN